MTQSIEGKLSTEDAQLIETSQLGTPLQIYRMKVGYIRFYRLVDLFTLVLAWRIALKAANPKTNGNRKKAMPTGNVTTRGRELMGKARLSSTPTSKTVHLATLQIAEKEHRIAAKNDPGRPLRVKEIIFPYFYLKF